MQEAFDFLGKLNIPFRRIDSYKRWRRTHFVTDNTVVPFQDNMPRQSWSICLSKNYKQLVNGEIFKCPQVAYVKNIKKQTHNAFDIMKQYIPINSEASIIEIQNFFNKEDENICSLCPAKTEYFKKQI
jgi:hypothetical protein